VPVNCVARAPDRKATALAQMETEFVTSMQSAGTTPSNSVVYDLPWRREVERPGRAVSESLARRPTMVADLLVEQRASRSSAEGRSVGTRTS
jgi:hypothetical protein